jgi:ribosomal protein S17E|tara:strand:+ start:8870 stop:9052 length:183 start_codon:yes stop_codon:yes gene_type:complete
MGRIRKYFTKKEQREAQRKWQMEHYERNKDKLRKVARDRYRKKRQDEIAEERRKQLYGES